LGSSQGLVNSTNSERYGKGQGRTVIVLKIQKHRDTCMKIVNFFFSFVELVLAFDRYYFLLLIGFFVLIGGFTPYNGRIDVQLNINLLLVRALRVLKFYQKLLGSFPAIATRGEHAGSQDDVAHETWSLACGRNLINRRRIMHEIHV